MTSWFTRPMERVPTVPHQNPAARLAEADAALRRAKLDHAQALLELGKYFRTHHPERMPWLLGDKLMVPVNLMKGESGESRALHARVAETHKALMTAQEARAAIMREFGLIR